MSYKCHVAYSTRVRFDPGVNSYMRSKTACIGKILLAIWTRISPHRMDFEMFTQSIFMEELFVANLTTVRVFGCMNGPMSLKSFFSFELERTDGALVTPERRNR